MEFISIKPRNLNELLQCLNAVKGYPIRYAAGCTDLMFELRKACPAELRVIHLSALEDVAFKGIETHGDAIWIGGGTCAFNIHNQHLIGLEFPVLKQAAQLLAGTQIRQVATIGGNLCTASPSGDMACALVALEAEIEVMTSEGTTFLLPIMQFFTGVRKTALKSGEFVYRIRLKRSGHKPVKSEFIKIGTRRSMECSVVSLSTHIEVDSAGKVSRSGIALGAVAPTIRLAETAGSMLKGKVWSDARAFDGNAIADAVLECASPISDLRATAWYRSQVLRNLAELIAPSS